MNKKVLTRILRVFLLIVVCLSVMIYILESTAVKETLARPDFMGKFTRLQSFTNYEESFNSSSKELTTRTNTSCPKITQNLGIVLVNTTIVNLTELNVSPVFKNISIGGYYKPPSNCTTDRVAIIVPYRNRTNHLNIFLNNIHQFLMVQQLEYGIFIVEQYGSSSFNRGKLMNVGFVESQNLKQGGWDCFVFHDVDLLPTDTRNIYSCPNKPRHLSAAIDVFHYKLPYKGIFGGVTAMTKKQFTKVNGFSNDYWGWGGEDDDLYNRIVATNLSIERYDMTIARYIMLNHNKSIPNPKRHSLLLQTKSKFKQEGLSSLQYFVLNMNRYHLFTHIVVDIG